MTRETVTHLSEEALDDMLIGMGSAESRHHLAACAECTAKLETFHSDMNLFNQATMAWSESKPQRIPRSSSAPVSVFRLPLAFVSLAAIIVLMIAVGFPAWHREHSTSAVVSVDPPYQDSETQITQDNDLMQAVNEAISPEEVSPVEEYQLTGGIKQHQKTRPN